MSERLEATTDTSVRRPRTVAWVERAIPLAGVWSLMYAALAAFWAFGGAGFPFGTASDPGAGVSILASLDRSAAPAIAAVGLGGAAVALVMTRRARHGRVLHRALVAFAVLAAVTLALLIPDYRVLMAVAYTPIVLVGAPFGWPPGVGLADVWPWPVLNQAVLMAGGLIWAAAGLTYHRRIRGACGHCGRAATDAGWTTPQAAARWGRWAVAVAVGVPIVYAATRLAWAIDLPLGIPQEFLEELQSTGAVVAGAALGAMGLGGALLTLGLVQRWGEVFPRWMPWVGGRRVPPALATVPASLVSVLVTTAGLMFVRLQVTGTVRDLFGFLPGGWAALGPELLWPLWGVALAAATVAYHYRRRGPCGHCGRL